MNTKHKKKFVSTFLRFEHGAELKTDGNMRPPRQIAQGDESLTVGGWWFECPLDTFNLKTERRVRNESVTPTGLIAQGVRGWTVM